MRIVRNELDGAQAFQDGLCHVEGDWLLLMKMNEWFRASHRIIERYTPMILSYLSKTNEMAPT